MTPRNRTATILGMAGMAVLLILAVAWFLDSDAPLPGIGGGGESAASRAPDASSATAEPLPEIRREEAAPGEETSAPERVPGRTKEAIHGTVFDPRTREPVPEIEVLLKGVQLEQRLLTDAAGAFRTSETSGPECLRVTVTDRGTEVARSELESSFGPHAIRAPVGPTYPILFESPLSLPDIDWQARLVESRFRPEMPNALEVLEKGIRVLIEGRDDLPEWPGDDVATPWGGIDVSERAWPWIPVRSSEGGPWIRYPSVEHEPDPSYVLRLEVRQMEKGLVGRAPVIDTVGRQPLVRVVVGELSEHRGCQLVGSVVQLYDEGSSGFLYPHSSSRVILLPSESELSSTDGPPVFEEQQVGADGYFLFENIPPGRRTLLVYAGGYKLARSVVDLEKGLNILPEIRLRPSNDLRDTEIRFDEPRSRRSTSTRFASLLRLRAAGAFARAWFLHDPGHSGPGQRIRFWSLPDAEFLHLGIGRKLLPLWHPHTLKLRSSEMPVRLQLVEEAQLVPYGFDVSSSHGGKGPQSFQVYFGPGGVLETAHSATDQTRWKLPGEAPLRFTIWAPGFAPTCGTEADFRDEGGERIAKVLLEPGWGAVLYFRSGNPNTFLEDPGPWRHCTFPNASSFVGAQAAPPLPGVGILVDGDLVGRTDEEGRIRLAMHERPSLLELDSPGWELCATDRVSPFPRTNEYLPHRYLVWMERD